MSNISLIIIYLSISFVFMWLVFFLIIKRSKKHKSDYPILVAQFKKALKVEDNELTIHFGQKLIWNDHYSQELRKLVFDELDKRVLESPELKELWRDSHYKLYGVEPND